MASSDIGWPLVTNIIRRGKLNHTFGMVRRMANGKKRAHQGWDFYSEPGYRCYSIADGEVAMVRNAGAYGQQVAVKFRHDFDGDGDEDVLYAFYAHLSRIDVVKGQRVVKGQQIGLTGNSGNARSMRGKDQHLHFEIRTAVMPGRGLGGRMSPFSVFKHLPLKEAYIEAGPFRRL